MLTALPDIDLEKYTVGQRLQLIELIWQSIPEEEFVVPDSHKELIRQRIAQRDANPGGDQSWEEFKRELQAEGRGDVHH